jgi:hypothetical protein
MFNLPDWVSFSTSKKKITATTDFGVSYVGTWNLWIDFNLEAETVAASFLNNMF